MSGTGGCASYPTTPPARADRPRGDSRRSDGPLAAEMTGQQTRQRLAVGRGEVLRHERDVTARMPVEQPHGPDPAPSPELVPPGKVVVPLAPHSHAVLAGVDLHGLVQLGGRRAPGEVRLDEPLAQDGDGQ